MRTVIIADDEPITRMDLADMLTELDFQVVGQAGDGFDAVELCRAKRPDVVLMDVKMPVFDGLTAAETILQEELAGCVVLLTAFNDEPLIRRASEAGVSGYLVKPVAQRSLLPAIEVALAQSQRMRQARRQAEATQQKMQEERRIRKAQQYLAQAQGCSDTEAYQTMRRTAMDKRISMAVLAERILAQAQRADRIGPAKQMLAACRGYSEDRAYRYILQYARNHGCSPQQAAEQILALLKEEEAGRAAQTL
jgi:AmiR/NasT family two-component response regulator